MKQRSRKQLSAALLFSLAIASLLSSGCGTSHYFVPTTPLEKKQWQASLSWHYNFDGLAPLGRSVIPDMNAYIGVSDKTAVGFGTYIIPFFINHATLVTYSQRGEDYLSGWFHLKLLSPNMNPYLEVGTSYAQKADVAWHSFTAGIGLMPVGPWSNRMSPFNNTSIVPMLSYRYGGRDFEIEIAHRFGLTKAAIKAEFPAWPPHADTLVHITADELVGVSEENPSSQWNSLMPPHANCLGLALANGDTVRIFWDRIPYADLFHQPEIELQEWLGDSFQVGLVDDEFVVLDIDELRGAVENGRSITITRAPKAFVDKTSAMNSLFRDNSIATGFKFWPK